MKLTSSLQVKLSTAISSLIALHQATSKKINDCSWNLSVSLTILYQS